LHPFNYIFFLCDKHIANNKITEKDDIRWPSGHPASSQIIIDLINLTSSLPNGKFDKAFVKYNAKTTQSIPAIMSPYYVIIYGYL